jgi:catechol 2,3-dioxygenase-like lactoylglutathione lyase family enzyme
MSPAERPLQGATVDHVAFSVGDLDAMVAFYTGLGFDERARSDLTPAPVRVALLRNRAGAAIELIAHSVSVPAEHARNPVDAAARQGLLHVALHVGNLDATVAAVVAAGARLIASPSLNSRGDARFAYVADPEGNLVELTALRHPGRGDILGGCPQEAVGNVERIYDPRCA